MSLRTAMAHRNLLYLLSSKELRTRYRKSVLGWAWTLLNPISQVIIFSFVFLVAFRQDPPVGNPSGLQSYPLYFLAGMLPFNYFSISVNDPPDTRYSRAYLGFSGDEVELGGRSTDSEGDKQLVTSSLNLQTGVTYHVVGVIDFASGLVELFIDGELADFTTIDFDAAMTPATNSTNSALGAQDDGSYWNFDGRLDEARVATVARSADWIRAQHLSQLGSFSSVEAAEAY